VLQLVRASLHTLSSPCKHIYSLFGCAASSLVCNGFQTPEKGIWRPNWNSCDCQIEPVHARAIGRKATCLARLGGFDAAVACLEEHRSGGAPMLDLDDRIAEVLKQKAAYDKVRRGISLAEFVVSFHSVGIKRQQCTGRQ